MVGCEVMWGELLWSTISAETLAKVTPEFNREINRKTTFADFSLVFDDRHHFSNLF